jgi:hypothetical protein
MLNCWRCGSLNIVRTRSSLVDRLVRMVTGRKRVTCKKCLWTARVRWEEADDFVPQKSVLKAVDLARRSVEREGGVG